MLHDGTLVRCDKTISITDNRWLRGCTHSSAMNQTSSLKQTLPSREEDSFEQGAPKDNFYTPKGSDNVDSVAIKLAELAIVTLQCPPAGGYARAAGPAPSPFAHVQRRAYATV
ncbi:hypothetical protein NMY22_g20209 [Coprinellus aureogranulatus]|nr:hypothetical protein NMY22_g20209 [Coprinellus aureogranulatus]